jgi:DnaJ-class molecular chaperone
MDYYSTLGVKRGATDDEIKAAYRKAAMKHHPDRGGDETTFKKISEAYDVLSDPEKKRMIDRGIDPNSQPNHPYGNSFNQGPFDFHFGGAPPGMDDIFSRFTGFGGRPQRKNKSLNIVVDLTLEEVLTGKEVNAELTIPGSNKKRMINIVIPPGIESGQQIRYEGMGDDLLKDIRPGDLLVNVNVLSHPTFRRENSSIIIEKVISVWDAILGTSIDIETLDGKTLNINIPKGSQPGMILNCRGEGLPLMRTRQRGNLLIQVKMEVPVNLSEEQINLIKEIKQKI